MKKKMFFIFFSIQFFLLSQKNTPSCMDEDIENHTYITCGFHTTIMKTTDGFQIFGAKSSPTGKNLLSPTDISPENGFNYGGEIITVTLGDRTNEKVETPRMFVLTTKGLYTWGEVGTTISKTLVSTEKFTKIDLPKNISPTDVKKIEASYAGLILLTKLGDVYVIGIKQNLFGDESTNLNIWHKPKGITNVKYISTADCVAFAYTSDGKYYTWGTNNYLGDGIGQMPKSLPAEMIPPFQGHPKMIVVGTGGTYLVLGSDKKVYALGNNNVGQLGTGNYINTFIWTNVLNSDGTKPLENISFINTTNNHSSPFYFGSSSAITSDGNLYLWGSNNTYMISDAAPMNTRQTLPISPSGFKIMNNKAVYVENGGHITPYVDVNQKKYGYVGHLIAGSMGTGTETEGTIKEYDITNTPKIDFCFIGDVEITINCNKVDFTLDISESNYSINWDFGDNSPIETTTNSPTKQHIYNKSGTYKVGITIQHDNGTKTITKTIDITLINVTLGEDIYTCEKSVSLNSGYDPSNGYEITWILPSGIIVNNSKILNAKESGKYKIFVSKDLCKGYDEINVTINDIKITASDQNECGEAQLNAGDFPNNFSIIWQKQDGTLISSKNTIKVTESGLYTVIVTSDKGCKSSKDINVTIYNKPFIFETDKIDCEEVLLNAGNFPKNYSIIWKNQIGTIISSQNTIKVKESGIYTISVISDKGCLSSKDINVSISNKPVITETDKENCEEVILNAGDFNNNHSIKWQKQDGSFFSNQNTVKITESGLYTVSVTNNSGCESSKVINVIINDIPKVNEAEIIFCKIKSDDTFEFDLTKSFSQISNLYNEYNFSFHLSQKDALENENLLPLYITNITNSQTLYVRVESQKGCVSHTTLFLNVIENSLEKITDLTNCDENYKGYSFFNLQDKNSEIISIINFNDSTFEYYLNLNDASKGINKIKDITYFSNKTAKSIIVRAYIPNQCSRYFIFDLITLPQPKIKEVKINNNIAEIIATGKPPLNYSLDLFYWQNSPFFNNLENKIYKAYVKNSNGCISNYHSFPIINIPNIISPNKDGFNDTWNIYGLEAYPGSRIRIFNVSGKLLVDKLFTNNPVWDGTYLGRYVQSNTYWYIIDLTNGIKLTGWIIIKNY